MGSARGSSEFGVRSSELSLFSSEFGVRSSELFIDSDIAKLVVNKSVSVKMMGLFMVCLL